MEIESEYRKSQVTKRNEDLIHAQRRKMAEDEDNAAGRLKTQESTTLLDGIDAAVQITVATYGCCSSARMAR